MSEKPLDERRKLFARLFAVCGNATQAAIEAGYKEHSAASTAVHLRKDPRVQAEIQRQGAEVEQRALLKVKDSRHHSSPPRQQELSQSPRAFAMFLPPPPSPQTPVSSPAPTQKPLRCHPEVLAWLRQNPYQDPPQSPPAWNGPY